MAFLPRYTHLTLVDASATADPSLPQLPLLQVALQGPCDATPHLSSDAKYEHCTGPGNGEKGGGVMGGRNESLCIILFLEFIEFN